MAAQARVGIVVLHWNNEPASRRLLESLARVTAPPHRVYLVDNGSVDGSMDHLERDFAAAGHAFIRNGVNLGFSGGCNVGIRRAFLDGMDFVLLLNNDCIVTDPGFLAAMVSAAERDPGCGIVGAKMMRWPDQQRIWSTGGYISGWWQRYVGDGEIDRGQYDRPEARRFISGAVMLIRRAVIENIGPLPEAYFFGHEDWEYSVRAHQAGFRMRYEPTAVIHHESSHSHDTKDPFYVYNDLLSRMLFEKRVLGPRMFRLWCALYGAYLDVALPGLRRLFPRRYLPGVSGRVLLACMRAALRDIEWIDRITPAVLERFRVRFAGLPSRPLRVAHVVATSGLTGVESHLRVLFEGLRAEHVDSYLVCSAAGPLTQALEERGFEVRLAAPRGRLGLLGLPRLARALAGADLVHAHGPRPLWWTAVLGAVGAAPPRVGTVHQLDVSGVGSAWKRPLFRWIERQAIHAQRRVIVVSRVLREAVLRSTGLDARVVHWVPNSAPILLDAERPLTAPNPPPRIVVLARLSPEKCLSHVLDAWADPRLADRGIVLRIAGDGPERAALESQARALGIAQRVEFLGWRGDALAHVEGALALISPGRSEPFGIAALEAMALGVPVIATDVVGHRDVLGDEFREWMVPAENADAIADALVALLALPAEARAELGRRLARRARDTFGPERSARGTRAVYDEALGRAADGPNPLAAPPPIG